MKRSIESTIGIIMILVIVFLTAMSLRSCR